MSFGPKKVCATSYRKSDEPQYVRETTVSEFEVIDNPVAQLYEAGWTALATTEPIRGNSGSVFSATARFTGTRTQAGVSAFRLRLLNTDEGSVLAEDLATTDTGFLPFAPQSMNTVLETYYSGKKVFTDNHIRAELAVFGYPALLRPNVASILTVAGHPTYITVLLTAPTDYTGVPLVYLVNANAQLDGVYPILLSSPGQVTIDTGTVFTLPFVFADPTVLNPVTILSLNPALGDPTRTIVTLNTTLSSLGIRGGDLVTIQGVFQRIGSTTTLSGVCNRTWSASFVNAYAFSISYTLDPAAVYSGGSVAPLGNTVDNFPPLGAVPRGSGVVLTLEKSDNTKLVVTEA